MGLKKSEIAMTRAGGMGRDIRRTSYRRKRAGTHYYARYTYH